MRPSRSTTIWSAWRTVEQRCEIRMVVRARITSFSRRRIFSSVSVSTLESASSRIRIRGERITARAHHRFQLLGKTLDVAPQAGDLRGLADALGCPIIDPEGDVLLHRVAEKESV